MVVPEHPIVGIKEMAEFQGMSLGWVIARLPKWKKMGIVKRRLIGKPPNRKWRLITYPSLFHREFIDLP